MPLVAQVLMGGGLTPPEIPVDDVGPEVLEDGPHAVVLISGQMELAALELTGYYGQGVGDGQQVRMLLVGALVEVVQGHHHLVGRLEPRLLDVARCGGHQLKLIKLIIRAEQDLALIKEVLEDPVPQQGAELPHASVAALAVEFQLLGRLEAVAVEDRAILPPGMQQWVDACHVAVQRGQDGHVPRDAHGRRLEILLRLWPPELPTAHVDQRPSLIRVIVLCHLHLEVLVAILVFINEEVLPILDRFAPQMIHDDVGHIEGVLPRIDAPVPCWRVIKA